MFNYSKLLLLQVLDRIIYGCVNDVIVGYMGLLLLMTIRFFLYPEYTSYYGHISLHSIFYNIQLEQSD